MAANNVSILLNRKIQIPPIPLKSIRKQGDTTVIDSEYSFYKNLIPTSIVHVYEIWQIFLNNNGDDLDYVFTIISGDNSIQGYRNGIWSNIKYRGFYTTIEEALNEIKGYLK